MLTTKNNQIRQNLTRFLCRWSGIKRLAFATLW